MIQIEHFASVLPPVCCCHTGDLEDARIQADKRLSAAKKQIISRYLKNLTAWVPPRHHKSNLGSDVSTRFLCDSVKVVCVQHQSIKRHKEDIMCI